MCASAVGYYGYNRGDTTFDEKVTAHRHVQKGACGRVADLMCVLLCVV